MSSRLHQETQPGVHHALAILVFALAWLLPGHRTAGAENPAAAHFRAEIQPILSEYCFDCHADGMKKGKVAFDEFKSDEDLLNQPGLWLNVLKNLRAGLMPPEKKPRPTGAQLRRLEEWIKTDAFGIDRDNPDPGRVTLRRLNRVEYRNTIRDLMGHDFKVEDELPPDDTGYGFDTIGDVLTISPMLLEKYMQAAETIVAAAVPRVGRVVVEKTFAGPAWRPPGEKPKDKADRYSFYEAAKLTRTFKAEHAGTYRLIPEFEVLGQFDFDPGRCRVLFQVDEKEAWQHEFGWEAGKKSRHEFEQTWEAGEHLLSLELQPLVAATEKKNSLDLRLITVRVQGPLKEKHWERPKNFELFFARDVPADATERHIYAREILERFATKAFRRPVDPKTLDRLVAIAENSSHEPGKRFEDGVAQAMIPVLASPRFLFRVEETEVTNADGTGSASEKSLSARSVSGSGSGMSNPSVRPRHHPWVDEYALASRLSYFLWSTMPDDTLFRLAGKHQLRENMAAQVKRMLADVRSEALVENFVGQWLQVRDVEGIDINVRAVLARDRGEERNFNRERRHFQELRDIPEEKLKPDEKKELEELRAQFRRRFQNKVQIELDRDLRRALRQESEMTVAYVLRENRSALELLDGNYTFLNERLAQHYGLTNLHVTGSEMRRVMLPADDPRGGVLTQGAPLIVTSNPTRTSPVKRGLFVLDNILGLPPPPPPPDIPNLEDSEKEVAGRTPTLREVLAIHREKPLCASCHNRMDPLGLALENFNALGLWREKERDQEIDASGTLITGESFPDIRALKQILAAEHRLDFYRCLTEKMLTYALGRGLEYYDTQTLDQIVEHLDQDNGHLATLVMNIVESAPFQKRRNPDAIVAKSAPGESHLSPGRMP